MPQAVIIYKRREGAGSGSGYASRNATSYKEISKMSQGKIQTLLDENRIKEIALGSRKDIQAKAELKTVRLNIKRLGKRFNVVYKKICFDDSEIGVKALGEKDYHSQDPLTWIDERRLDEELFFKNRERTVHQLIKLIKSNRLVKVNVQLKDDGAWYQILKQKEVIKEIHISEIASEYEAREVLRNGLDHWLGTLFRAVISK